MDAAMTGLTRRTLLQRGIASGAMLALPPGLLPQLGGSARLDASLLPRPRDVLRDVERMVGFGQRLPGSDPHNAFIDWLDESFRAAGCRMLPRDEFPFTRWLAQSWSLEVLEGSDRGTIPVAGYQPYSGSTPPEGVVAPLVYLGPAPPLGLHGDPNDVKDLEATIERVQAHLADWAQAAIAGVPGGVAGRIVLVESQCAPLTERSFEPLTTYAHNPGQSPTATPDFKRIALSAIPPASYFAQAGAAGMIVTLDASDAAAAGTYGPYGSPIHGMPGLLVGRETGTACTAARSRSRRPGSRSPPPSRTRARPSSSGSSRATAAPTS
jgi:hypothetical protein